MRLFLRLEVPFISFMHHDAFFRAQFGPPWRLRPSRLLSLCHIGVLKELTFIRGTGISWVAILRSLFKI